MECSVVLFLFNICLLVSESESETDELLTAKYRYSCYFFQDQETDCEDKEYFCSDLTTTECHYKLCLWYFQVIYFI